MKGSTMSKYCSRTDHFSVKRLDYASVSYWSIVMLTFSLFSFGNIASAQDVAGAAKAFSQGQKAELSGDHAMAAEFFELADSLAPSPEALRCAIRSRKAAGHLGSAAINAEILRKRYPYDPKSQELAKDILLVAKKTLMRLSVVCKPRICNLLVDDAAAGLTTDNHHVIYVEPGPHEVVASFDNVQSDPQFVDAEAGKRDSLVFVYTPKTDQENEKTALLTQANSSLDGSNTDLRAANNEGLPIWYFLSGVVVTVGAGAATIWSGMDVLDLHDKYEQNQTQKMYKSGLDKERRTNILIGVTAVAGVTTGILAVFTQWEDSGEADSQSDLSASVGVGLNSGLLKVNGSF